MITPLQSSFTFMVSTITFYVKQLPILYFQPQWFTQVLNSYFKYISTQVPVIAISKQLASILPDQ